MVSDWFSQKSTDEWMKILSDVEVPCGPINTVDRILADPQVAALGILKTLVHPTSGLLQMVGAPFHLSTDSTEPYRPPPLLGEHTAAILKEFLAIGDEEFVALQQAGTFGKSPGGKGVSGA